MSKCVDGYGAWGRPHGAAPTIVWDIYIDCLNSNRCFQHTRGGFVTGSQRQYNRSIAGIGKGGWLTFAWLGITRLALARVQEAHGGGEADHLAYVDLRFGGIARQMM